MFNMDDKRHIHQKPRAVRKLLDYHSCDDVENDDSPKKVSKFKFPPPPKVLPNNSPSKSSSPLWQSISDIETTSDSLSDTGVREASSPVPAQHHNTVYNMRGYQSDGSPVTTFSRCLPPIGVFWDIENCQIPRGRSAITVAQTIRDRFFDGYREVEFLVVCDVKKETAQVVQELNDAQVNLIHVGATSKNAADEKLRQSIRRFADIHGSPSAVVLISGDINFAPDLCDLRHRKKVHVILIHNEKCSESLILCANEHYNFSSLVSNLPYRFSVKGWNQPSEVLVSNLPAGQDHGRIRHRLKRLAENCGGRVGFIQEHTTTIRFPSLEAAARAQKRMDGEKVFGSAIAVGYPVKIVDFKEGSPLKSNQNRKISLKMDDDVFVHPNANLTPFHSVTPSAQNWQKMPYNGNSFPQLQALGASGDHGLARSKSMANTQTLMEQVQRTPSQAWSPGWNWASQPKGRPILGARDSDGTKITNQTMYFTPNRQRAVSTTMLKRTRAESPAQETILYHSYQNGMTPPRKCRTPSPYTLLGINTSIPPPPIVNLPRRKNDTSKENKDNQISVQPVIPQKPVELYVTNLDQNLDPLELKKILMSTFKDYVMVLHVAVFVQKNGNLTASVKVPSIQAAQTAIAHLQRHKVGLKHITIGYTEECESSDLQLVRCQIVSILSQMPGFRLPLLKFCEQYETRYGTVVNVPSLYSMQETCTISEESCGLFISLTFQQTKPAVPEKKVCQGCVKKTVPEECSSLPNVMIKLSVFSKNLEDLVSSHNHNLPLSNLVQCYEAEYGVLPVNDSGVPLEHLVTWVTCVELSTNTQGVKHLCSVSTASAVKDGSEDDSKENVNPSSVSPVAQLSVFSHELMELFRAQPRCQIMFHQFIPSYHQHFGRQCRVADYGFTRLIDLLEAVPKVVQVIGEGSKRILVPTRTVQIRLFTMHLMRVLRSQASKQFSLSEFSTLYERTFSRRFDPVDYGLCYLADLLGQVPEGLVVMKTEGPSSFVAIAKRAQTREEVELTMQFAVEILELLIEAPEYKMPLSKIIPAYHHHFKRQCRVSDYGFTKLVQLFDAIPQVVKLEEDDKERYVCLTDEKKLKVLCSQMFGIVSTRFPPGLPIANTNSAFLCKFGYALSPAAYGCTDLHDLLEKLHSVVKVCNIDGVPTLVPNDRPRIQQLSMRVRRVLMERPNAKMTLVDFQKAFQDLFNHDCTLETLEKDLEDTVKVSQDKAGEVTVQLTSLQLFARDVYRLLTLSEGRLAVGSFEAMYLRTLGTAVQPTQYGYKNVISLLQAIPHTVQIRGKGNKQILIFNKEIQAAGIVLPSSVSKLSPSQDNTKAVYSTNTNTDSDSSVSDTGSRDSNASNTLTTAQVNLLHGLVSKTQGPKTNVTEPDLTSQCRTSSAQLPCMPHIKAPDPSELPLPQLLTSKQEQQTLDTESSADDVCVLAVDLLQKSCSTLDVVESNSAYLVNSKRKIRLAAQFQTPIQLI